MIEIGHFFIKLKIMWRKRKIMMIIGIENIRKYFM